MNPRKPHRTIQPNFSGSLAEESSRNRGLLGIARATSGRLTKYAAKEFEHWAGTRELSLRQLRAELVASAFPEAWPDAESSALISLIAQDLRDAALWPVEGRGPDSVRPLSAWRARYNDLDRCLRPVQRPAKSALMSE
ncbi:hypothetical protein M2650_02710 [Luteimonas sp. SX5]|uniref:Uncharacterized protein n=1 Tax=Luteimonas galliterrae TaxID=2940486 RepID=A0ABT0MFA7_9GAMM|nr:hypothetical protein [Luteimonas galliterrae]MCL1633557.1 hypothetical protein [Luteimonas galliterrae]